MAADRSKSNRVEPTKKNVKRRTVWDFEKIVLVIMLWVGGVGGV